MIELKNITKVFKLGKNEVRALDGINLQINDGEFVVILGQSGSGKSSLMHLLGGLSRPSSGEIIIDGKDMNKLSDKDLSFFRNKQVGFVFQEYNLNPIFNAEENAALPLILAKEGDETINQKSTNVLAMVGLSNRAKHKPKELSGGEQQRVAIARSIINEPRIVLADEPTGNLDSATGNQIINLLLNLNKQNKITLVIVTHNEEIANLADKVVKIADGKLQ